MKNLDRLNSRLEYYLTMTEVLPNGAVVEKRFLVASINNVRIEIYPNEHPPPHFHVKTNEFNTSFDIINCKLLKGVIGANDRKKIEAFHKANKLLLIDTWNELRTSDCSVGRIEIVD